MVDGRYGMPRGANRVQALCLEVIRTISASPLVEGYKIGFTFQPLLKRGDQYRGVGFHGLALMADKMTRSEALTLEENLWSAIGTSDQRTPVFRKFQKDQSRYRKSFGGSSREFENLPIHGVYIAWWTAARRMS
jgi:hypothetical protein